MISQKLIISNKDCNIKILQPIVIINPPQGGWSCLVGGPSSIQFIPLNFFEPIGPLYPMYLVHLLHWALYGRIQFRSATSAIFSGDDRLKALEIETPQAGLFLVNLGSFMCYIYCSKDCQLPAL